MKSEDVNLGDMLIFRLPTGRRKYLAVVVGFMRSKLGSARNKKAVYNKICFIDEDERLRTMVTPSSLLEPLDDESRKSVEEI